MNDRIKALCDLTLEGKMFVEPVKTEFDRQDHFLDTMEMESKRLCEYIINQEPKITEHSMFTGMFNFDGSVVGDAFNRSGHKNTSLALEKFYLKKIDNLSTMEWQHATGDYTRVLDKGLLGIISDIEDSLKLHKEEKEIKFLYALKKVASAMILWAEKCSRRVLEYANTISDSKAKLDQIALCFGV